MERRLAAILTADVVSYSRLIRSDEEGTLVALRTLRQELIDPKIVEHHGRIVKLMGDGMLVEFGSVVNAVACGAEVQRSMAERNIGTPDAQRIVFRIGINLGDVVIDGDDIQGDGVNVAARLESLSKPGGICISNAVYEQVRDRLDLAFEDLGEQNVKNIDRSIRAWTWTASMGGATVKIPAGGTISPLPDKPSIAVLPFDNMSGDPEQEYFADGIAEDVITALARMRGLFVVARNSSFSYRGQSPDIRQVGRELGVRYVLEGSVRRAGQRVRITAQLIDAETGRHIWAERYDRLLDDIFEVQDEITVSVTGTVGSEISAAESERAATLRIEDLTAWDRGAKALWYLHKTTAEGTAEALKICLEEIERSGGNSQIHALLSLGYVYNLIYAWGEQAPVDVAVQAARAGRSAIDLDAKNELAHTLLACVLWTTGNHDAAIREAEIAVDLNPNLPLAHVQHGASLGFSGAEHHAKAQDCFERAIRLAPRDIWVCWPYAIWACLDTVAGRYDAAIEHAREALGHFPRLGLAHRTLAFALALSGQLDEAKAAWARAIEIQPVDPALYAEALRRMFKLENEAERLIEAMRLVGARVE